jgi:gamma-glutamyltranspeptidase/glutathione hydrolase
MAPAIKYAEEGFKLLPGEARHHALVAKQLSDSEGARQYFMNEDGKTFPAGHLLVQKDLAAVLRAIALGGKDAFYKGEIAQKIAADMQKNGGLVSVQDLANYEAKEAKLVSGNYRGYDLHGLWLPSFGAITTEILHILENWSMSDLAEAERVAIINEAIQAAYMDRSKQYEEGDMAKLLSSKEYAKEVAQKIKAKGISMEIEEGMPSSWTAAIGHTTHLSTADANGMMVALTQSNGPLMGSKVATPGLGFMYAVSLGEYLRIFSPNQRVSSHISPMLVTKDGEPFLGLGAAGGARIIPAVVHVIHRVIDQNMTIDKALAAPRIYPNRDTLELEDHEGIEWEKAVIDQLESKGYPLKFIDRKGRFARVHAVRYHAEKKKWVGGADPDWEGAASPPKK